MVLKEFQHLACRVSNGEAQNIFFQKHASLISVEQSSVLRYDRLGTRRSIATTCPYRAYSSKSKNIEAYQM